MIHPAIALPLGSAVNVVAAIVAAKGERRVLSLAITLGALVIPFYTDAPPLIHQLQGGILGLQTLRVIQIVREPARWSIGWRVVRVALMYETDLMKRAPRSMALPMRAAGVAMAALCVGSTFVAARFPPATPYALAGWPRWIITMIGGYFFLEGFGRLWVSDARAFGWEHPLIQRSPIRSNTLAEFWGRRWNIVVSRMLDELAFRPLARRRSPGLGLFAAFATSALVHAYMTLPAAGLVPAIWMGSFFLLHGVATAIERRLRLGRIFVYVVFLATIPLFAEAFLRGFGL